MKLTCNARALHRAFAAAARAALANASLGLPAVVLEAQGAAEADDAPPSLVLSASDRALGLRTSLDPAAAALAVEEGGACAVPARLVADVLQSIAKGPAAQNVSLALDADRSALTVRSARGGTYAVRTYDRGRVAAFPERPPDAAVFHLPYAALRRAFARATPFASEEANRPVLSSTRLALVKGGEGARREIQAVSTDSYRLALSGEVIPEDAPTEGLPDGDGEQLVALLPARALQELARAASAIFGDGGPPEDRAAVSLTGDVASFELGEPGRGGLLFSTSLVAGQFPDFGRLMPGAFEGEYAVEAAPLADALKRAALFGVLATANAASVTLRAVFGEEAGPGTPGAGFDVCAQGAETGSSRERVPATMLDGAEISAPFAITFNARYLADAVSAADSKVVALKTNGPSKPVIVAPVVAPDEAKGSSMSILVMPMRDPVASAAAAA